MSQSSAPAPGPAPTTASGADAADADDASRAGEAGRKPAEPKATPRDDAARQDAPRDDAARQDAPRDAAPREATAREDTAPRKDDAPADDTAPSSDTATPDGTGNREASDAPELDAAEGTGLGFFGRIIAALSPAETADADAAPGGRPGTVGLPTPGMLNLRRMRVEDVLIPKADIVAVPLTHDRDDLVEVFRSSGLTRLPVFDGTLDSPVGFVNLKDFALRHGFGDETTLDLAALVRPLLYVPPSMPLGVLLQKMQAERTHMALVIDEYGGTDGLVTIEDLIEQVVGEIEDEHDVDEVASIVAEKPGVWIALAKAPLEEVEAVMGRSLTATEAVDEEEVDTLGGLVIMLAGHVPARGEVIRHPDGPEFEVMEADPRRIKRVRVRLEPAAKAVPAE